MAHFSKHHYIKLAQVMQKTRPDVTQASPEAMAVWLDVMANLTQVLIEDNEHFDKYRFGKMATGGA